MATKICFVLCASAVLVQAITAQCIGNAASIGVTNIGVVGNGLPSINLGCGNDLNFGTAGLNFGAGGLNFDAAGLNCGQLNLGAPVNGGAFIVTSSSPIAPSSLSVVSENQLQGPVNVFGALPFLAAAALEGQVQSGGGAGVVYRCGNGNIGIVSENAVAALTANYGSLSGISYGSSLAGAGLGGASLAGCGLAAPLLAAPVAPIGASCSCGGGFGY